ncbi:hypothetical protein SAMN05216338_10784 [Bradyrhizobium sp. Rc2d]|nr:hypothetical protein SAMN05216338_10784 [Bradyrhizobium sp. Rc2d]
MLFKLIDAASKTWRRLNGTNQLPKIIAGVSFADGIEVVPIREATPPDRLRHPDSGIAPTSEAWPASRWPLSLSPIKFSSLELTRGYLPSHELLGCKTLRDILIAQDFLRSSVNLRCNYACARHYNHVNRKRATITITSSSLSENLFCSCSSARHCFLVVERDREDVLEVNATSLVRKARIPGRSLEAALTRSRRQLK